MSIPPQHQLIIPPTDAYAWPSLHIDHAGLLQDTQSMIDHACVYRLGAKAPSLSVAPNKIAAIDCSGFSRLLLFRNAGIAIPDGSVNQHDWCIAQGFKRSDVTSGGNHDGAVRIAFLSPTAGGGVGHVMLLPGDGRTCESFGHHGPGRRAWDTDKFPFMGLCSVYVLSPPPPPPPPPPIPTP